ncbi:glycosyltransferase [Methanosphaera sp. BMS]|uniref:glycosyltransferase n=1 Tax=Methanosphaera sp. BMS TaxID=1789762 RepID=UPI000DC1DAA0|nr:glycosyltransferase [Methanosphaera sp. BMS]AWX32851.1 hypothetical protein AW729_06955 [Methanosphaera sp. BMS]
MRILVLCHDIPSMSVGATIPIHYMIKELSKVHQLDLISFNSHKYDIKALEGYLNNYKSIDIKEYHSIKDQLIYTTKNMLSSDNLKTRSILNYYYDKNMNRLIQENIQDHDLIIADLPMAFYVKNVDKKKIVYAFDAVSDYNYQMYKKSDSLTSRIYWYLNYLKINNYEKCYDKFDRCIVVNKKDKKLLEKKLNVQVEVVANGVDTEYFTNNSSDENVRLVFLGDMSTPPNNDAVKYFTEEIYPLVLAENNIELYIVGRNPTEYVKGLNNDNIIVTGSVDDVRDYLTKNAIFITPMISGTGIKNKILEAMSMQLAVISTSCGISGIDAINEIEYLCADNSMDFKDAIIKLCDDADYRHYLAKNARILVENKYSWNSSAEKINRIIEEIFH